MCNKAKLDTMVKEAIKDLYDDLHPEKRGMIVTDPSVHLVTIAKYEGMALILEKLGADVSNLEEVINAELHRILYKDKR